MGLFDVLRGKRELKKPAADRLFGLVTAVATDNGTSSTTSSVCANRDRDDSSISAAARTEP